MKSLPIQLRLLLLLFFCLSQTGFAQKPDSIPAYQPPPAIPVHPDNKFTPLKATTAGGCLPTLTYGCSYDDGLNGFVVNGVPLSTNSSCPASGYSSFTATATDVSPGKSYSFSATLLSSAYQEGVAIWADLNGNQLFETSEKIYETPTLQVAGLVTGAFTIPAGTPTGPMAIRVMVTYNLLNLSLCGNYLYGEVEDYVLNVVSSTGCNLPAVTLAGPTVITQGQAATLLASQTGDVPYSVTIGNSQNTALQVFNNQTTATLSFTTTPATTTTYSVLSVSNTCGATSGGTAVTVTVAPCDVPAGLSESEKTTYSIRLNWRPALTASSYTIVWREAGAATSTTYTYGNSSTYTYLNPMTFGKAYEWQIRTNCIGGFSTAFSPVRSFTMSCPEPFNVTEVATGRDVQLQWGYQYSSATPVNYTIQWRPVGGAWQTISGYCCSSYTLSNLTLGTTYEWQIRTNCPDGSSTSYYTIRTFTVTCSPPYYAYLDYRTSTTARVYWPSSNNTTYTIQWRPQSPANSPFTSVSGLGSAYTITGLTNGTGYNWQVRADCAAGQQSGFTALQSFTTACATITYNLTPRVGPDAAYLSWQNFGTGIRYNLVWQAVGSPLSTTVNLLTSSSYSLTGLTTGTVYTYRIQTVCTDGSISSFSSPYSFTTQCAQPSYTYIWTIGSNSVYLEWGNSGLPGTRYDLVYRVFGSPTSSTISSLVSTNTYSNYTYTLSGLLSGTAYEWQVRTQCTDGSSSAVTMGQSFTTLSCPVPSGLAEVHITSTAARLRWTVEAGSRYVLQWRQTGATGWPLSLTFSPTYGGTYDQVISGLTDGNTYEWQVGTLCADGLSSPFAGRTFTTGCNAPTLLFNNSITSTGASVSWSGVYSTCRVRWRLAGATTWVESNTFVNTSYVITGLTSGNVYEWQPGSVCWNGAVVYPPSSLTFTTACNAPGTYTPSVNDTFTTLYWTSGDTGTTYDAQYQQAGASSWISATGITSSNILLTGLTPSTTYNYQVRARCSGGQVSPFNYAFSFTTSTACGIITSIRDGYWWDSSVWSCNRIPTPADPVEIRHSIIMPNYYTGFAKQLGYGRGGRLIYQTAGKLQLGQ